MCDFHQTPQILGSADEGRSTRVERNLNRQDAEKHAPLYTVRRLSNIPGKRYVVGIGRSADEKKGLSRRK